MISYFYLLADKLRHAARQRTSTPASASGAYGEDLAHRFLRRRKYTVVARNYRPRSGPGEIDLIAWDGATLVFIEVKTRASDQFGSPDRAVDQEKQLHLQRAARDYARRADVDWSRVRFDVLTVLSTRPPELNLLRDAFGTGSKL
ncbi:MAG: YraN family protein [Acidobacteriota bacterium]|nr:YraN family protein [Acidobacteriota bacterium]